MRLLCCPCCGQYRIPSFSQGGERRDVRLVARWAPLPDGHHRAAPARRQRLPDISVRQNWLCTALFSLQPEGVLKTAARSIGAPALCPYHTLQRHPGVAPRPRDYRTRGSDFCYTTSIEPVPGNHNWCGFSSGLARGAAHDHAELNASSVCTCWTFMHASHSGPVHRYTGEKVHDERLEVLLEAAWRPGAPGAFPDLPQSPKANGAAKPAFAPPPAAAGYVAPHLRGSGGAYHASQACCQCSVGRRHACGHDNGGSCPAFPAVS